MTDHNRPDNSVFSGARANLDHVDYVVEVKFPRSDVINCSGGGRDLWRYPDTPVLLYDYPYKIYPFPNAVDDSLQQLLNRLRLY